MGKGALFMKAKGVRLHGANDLRLEEFELPEITEDEILVKVRQNTRTKFRVSLR